MALFNGSGQWGHIICGVKILKHNAVYRFKVEYSKLYIRVANVVEHREKLLTQ